MSQRIPSVFVQQRTYRRRRTADAARLLPILGGILFMLPLLWIAEPANTRTASVMIYVFVVWVGLAGVSWLLSRRLGPEEDMAEDTDTAEDQS